MESFFDQLKSHLLISWKTTVSGFISGAAVLVANYGVTISPGAQMKITTFVVGIGLFLIGFFSRDAHKSDTNGTE